MSLLMAIASQFEPRAENVIHAETMHVFGSMNYCSQLEDW